MPDKPMLILPLPFTNQTISIPALIAVHDNPGELVLLPPPFPTPAGAAAAAAGADPLASALNQALQFPGQLINSLGQGVGSMGAGIFGNLGGTVQSLLMAPFNAMKQAASAAPAAQSAGFLAAPSVPAAQVQSTGIGYFA